MSDVHSEDPSTLTSARGPPTTTLTGVSPVSASLVSGASLTPAAISSQSHVIGLPWIGSLHLIGGLNYKYDASYVPTVPS